MQGFVTSAWDHEVVSQKGHMARRNEGVEIVKRRRQLGKQMGQNKRISQGFRTEMKRRNGTAVPAAFFDESQ